MEAKKLISQILTFIFFSSFVSIAQNIEIAPLISLDQLEPTYDQEEKEDSNINENKIPSLGTQDEVDREMLVTLKILNKITANVAGESWSFFNEDPIDIDKNIYLNFEKKDLLEFDSTCSNFFTH